MMKGNGIGEAEPADAHNDDGEGLDFDQSNFGLAERNMSNLQAGQVALIKIAGDVLWDTSSV